MASLAGAVTFLTLAATPGQHTWFDAGSYVGSGRPDDGQFTALQVTATPGHVQSEFTDKAVEVDSTKPVSDTYRPVLTFGQVTQYDIEVSDKYVPVLTMSGVARLTKVVTDTYRPRLTFGTAIVSASGTINKTASDTYVPVLTFAPNLQYRVTATDTYVPVLTFAADPVTTANATNVSDTYVPVLTFFNQTLTKVVANVAHARSDTYVARLTFTANLRTAGEVDRIEISSRPYGYIEITQA
jgi:hypothetical protein